MATNFPTSVDALTNPVSNDSLNSPSHSAQHANANDAIEAIEDYIINGTGGTWISFTPTISGGFTTGDGTWNAQYSRIGKIVNFQAVYSYGASSVAGTLVVTLPLTAKAANSAVFNGWSNAGGSAWTLSVRQNSTTTMAIAALNAAGTYVGTTNFTTTIPGTWATGNIIAITGTYEAA